jgi:hypothetical protein
LLKKLFFSLSQYSSCLTKSFSSSLFSKTSFNASSIKIVFWLHLNKIMYFSSSFFKSVFKSFQAFFDEKYFLELKLKYLFIFSQTVNIKSAFFKYFHKFECEI